MAHGESAELWAAGGERAEDREGAAGVRRGGAGIGDADGGGDVDAALLRRSRRSAGSVGVAELDYAGGGAGVAIFPAGGLVFGRDSRAVEAAEGLSGGDESIAGRSGAAGEGGDLSGTAAVGRWCGEKRDSPGADVHCADAVT